MVNKDVFLLLFLLLALLCQHR